MDLSFARRNSKWSPAAPVRINLLGLLAEAAARQATTPTALLQAKNNHNEEIFSNFCSQAALFAPVHQERKQRGSASFSKAAAAMITEYQSS
jgi:hypothetical protein